MSFDMFGNTDIESVLDKISKVPFGGYTGNKRKVLKDIWVILEKEKINFDSVFDAFSGSAVFSLFMKNMGKKVIAIDLNPLSRTARKATVTIVDNILRAVPNLSVQAQRLSSASRADLERIVQGYDNNRILKDAAMEMRNHLEQQLRNSLDWNKL